MELIEEADPEEASPAPDDRPVGPVIYGTADEKYQRWVAFLEAVEEVEEARKAGELSLACGCSTCCWTRRRPSPAQCARLVDRMLWQSS